MLKKKKESYPNRTNFKKTLNIDQNISSSNSFISQNGDCGCTSKNTSKPNKTNEKPIRKIRIIRPHSKNEVGLTVMKKETQQLEPPRLSNRSNISSEQVNTSYMGTEDGLPRKKRERNSLAKHNRCKRRNVLRNIHHSNTMAKKLQYQNSLSTFATRNSFQFMQSPPIINNFKSNQIF